MNLSPIPELENPFNGPECFFVSYQHWIRMMISDDDLFERHTMKPYRDIVGLLQRNENFGVYRMDTAHVLLSPADILAYEYLRACWELLWQIEYMEEPNDAGFTTHHLRERMLNALTDEFAERCGGRSLKLCQRLIQLCHFLIHHEDYQDQVQHYAYDENRVFFFREQTPTYDFLN